jgi:hypothetical protein
MFFLPQVLKRNTDENIYYARACIGQSACVCGVWCVCVWCVYVVCVCVCVCVLYI